MLLLSRFRIIGHSMGPALSSGQRVLVSGIPYFFSHPQVGDIVAVVLDGTKKVYIKRVTKQAQDTYFLAGDNTADSRDSRQFGWVTRSVILGKALFL